VTVRVSVAETFITLSTSLENMVPTELLVKRPYSVIAPAALLVAKVAVTE
jgi:hypothetical protein